MGTSTGHLWNLVAGCPGDQMMEHSRDVQATIELHSGNYRVKIHSEMRK